MKAPTCERATGGISFSGLGESRLVSILGGESGMTENVNKKVFFLPSHLLIFLRNVQ